MYIYTPLQGYRVARVEQTETPDAMKEHNRTAGKGNKVRMSLCVRMYIASREGVYVSTPTHLPPSHPPTQTPPKTQRTVVSRELCSVLSKGTRTICYLDEAQLLEGKAGDGSGALLMAIKEEVSAPPAAAVCTCVNVSVYLCICIYPPIRP